MRPARRACGRAFLGRFSDRSCEEYGHDLDYHGTVLDLTRRVFLATCAGAISGVAAAEERPTYVYAAESFSRRGAPLVTGFLLTAKPAEHIHALHELKRGTRFNGALVYHSTDKHKIGYARELCHYFARDPELRFVASIVYSARPTETFPERFRLNQYSELFSRGRVPSVPSKAVLRLKGRPKETGYGRHRRHGDELQKARVDALLSQGLIASGEAIPRSAQDGLLDMASVLTGCIGSAWLAAHINTYSPAKIDLVARLRGLLQIASLEAGVPGKWEVATKRVPTAIIAEHRPAKTIKC